MKYYRYIITYEYLIVRMLFIKNSNIYQDNTFILELFEKLI